MSIQTTLPIGGYRGERLPPGFGYACDMPLFHYADIILTGRGWYILRVDDASKQAPQFAA